jgi:hypothetical protein
MITLLFLIIVVAILFGGFGYGGASLYPANPIGIVLVLLVALLLFGAFGGTYWGWWR